MRTNIDNIKGKKILVVGLGKSGIAAAQAMIELGAQVYIQDSGKEEGFDPSLVAFFKGKGAVCYFNQIPPEMGIFDMIILSPGVSPELEFIREGAELGAEITGELEIAYRIGKGEYVAITGTNGKTTTTTLTGEIFERAGRKTRVAGNIGTAVIAESMDSDESTWLVTETSSFQLETTRYFKPYISALLNLTPDHLNRHHTMKAYGEAKGRIFANQSSEGFLIVNNEDKQCMKLAKDAQCNVIPFSRVNQLDPGIFVRDGYIVVKDEENLAGQDPRNMAERSMADGSGTVKICSLDDIKIIGDHNIENVLAACGIAYFSGIKPAVIQDAVSKFNGVEHRIEYVGMVDEVRYYNDSKGTNVDAAVTALKALENNIILIAGGDAKKQDFSDFAKELKGRVKTLIIMGRDGWLIRDAAKASGFNNIIEASDMPSCVREAASIAEPGDSVLLSPACASWDMYDNYEQRGNHFKECVETLVV